MLTWQAVVDSLLQSPTGAIARIPVSQILHPVSAGMRQTFGFPVGQKATYSIPLSDIWSLYVDDFGEHYDVRLSQYLPPMPTEPGIPPGTSVSNGVPFHRDPMAVLARKFDPPAPTPSVGIEQAIKESPGTTLLMTTALGALFGALGGSKNSTLTGALLGGAAGLTAVSLASEDDPSRKAKLSADLAQAMAKLLAAKSTSLESGQPRAIGGEIASVSSLLPPAPEPLMLPRPTKARKTSRAKKRAASSNETAPSRRKRAK